MTASPTWQKLLSWHPPTRSLVRMNQAMAITKRIAHTATANQARLVMSEVSTAVGDGSTTYHGDSIAHERLRVAEQLADRGARQSAVAISLPALLDSCHGSQVWERTDNSEEDRAFVDDLMSRGDSAKDAERPEWCEGLL
jgi:hypothetical protein